MKRLLLIAIAALIGLSLSAQTVGYDEISISAGDVTGNDTTLYPKTERIKNCMGNLVIMRVTVQNTDAITDSLFIGGRDNDVRYDFGGDPFEVLEHSSMPFIIDTTDTDYIDGWAYDADGAVYVKTFSKSGYPFKIPGFKVTKWDLTQGDIKVYFYNVESDGNGNLDTGGAGSLTAAKDTVTTNSLSYDAATGSDLSTIINPVWAHRTSVEHGIDETNLDTDSVYVAYSMDTYQHFSLHYDISGGATITVYVTNISTASDTDETSDWIDYSTTILGAASKTDEAAMVIQDTPASFNKFLIKVVTSDATNALDVYVKRWY